MSTSIILNSKDGNEKSLSRTISYVNPDAADSKLITFAQAVNAVTNNTYVSTTKVTKRNLEDESKATRVITTFGIVGNTGSIISISLDTGKITLPFSRQYMVNEKPVFYFRLATPEDGSMPLLSDVNYTGETYAVTQTTNQYGYSSYVDHTWQFGFNSTGQEATTLTFHLHFNESPTYQAYDVDIEVTITNDEEG